MVLVVPAAAYLEGPAALEAVLAAAYPVAVLAASEAVLAACLEDLAASGAVLAA